MTNCPKCKIVLTSAVVGYHDIGLPFCQNCGETLA